MGTRRLTAATSTPSMPLSPASPVMRPSRVTVLGQEKIVSAVGQVDQVGVEAGQGVQGQSGGSGVVPLTCEQGTDAFRALQVTGRPAGGGRLGLAQQRDPRAGSLRALVGGQGDDIDLVLRPGGLVGDLGGTDRAGQSTGQQGVGVTVGEVVDQVLEVRP
jgi:hypothetical protein